MVLIIVMMGLSLNIVGSILLGWDFSSGTGWNLVISVAAYRPVFEITNRFSVENAVCLSLLGS
jgi:hypothetical protein